MAICGPKNRMANAMLPKMITFVEDMAQKGLTKKQFWIQMIMVIFWELYAAYWIIDGIVTKSSLRWMAGALFGLLYLAFAIYLIYQRKRYPIEDAQLDEQVGENFKTGMTGMGIVLGFITAAFLIAFGIAFLLK